MACHGLVFLDQAALIFCRRLRIPSFPENRGQSAVDGRSIVLWLFLPSTGLVAQLVRARA